MQKRRTSDCSSPLVSDRLIFARPFGRDPVRKKEKKLKRSMCWAGGTRENLRVAFPNPSSNFQQAIEIAGREDNKAQSMQ